MDITKRILSPVVSQIRNIPPIRKPFAYTTIALLPILALLGFSNFVLPMNDKLLHIISFGLITSTFYFSFDSGGDWQWSAKITFIICGGVGSIGSEFVQGLLPYKTFDFIDILANLTGFGLSLGICILIDVKISSRSRIAMYRNLEQDLEMNFDLDQDELDQDDLLTHNMTSSELITTMETDSKKKEKKEKKHVAFALDEQEEEE